MLAGAHGDMPPIASEREGNDERWGLALRLGERVSRPRRGQLARQGQGYHKAPCQVRTRPSVADGHRGLRGAVQPWRRAA
jgi:hypothetical protein